MTDTEKTLEPGDPHATKKKQSLGHIDQYELIRELGGGGFGTVFLARDTVAGIDVAVKGLPPLVRNNKEELENVRKNFALVTRLDHTHITAALVLHKVEIAHYADRSVAEKLRVFENDILSVMKYAPGVTLSLWRKQFPGGKVPPEKAIEIVRQIADALDYAHGERIIHRDIKPANVMIETKQDGTSVARVLDFGLAAEVRSSMGRVSRQVTDTSGTRPYMAPEQWLGKKQDAATDQYSLAVLAHELLTGEVPFASVFDTGDTELMKSAVVHDEPEIPADLPGNMRKALLRALEKDPKKRFPSCREFVYALHHGRLPWRAIAASAVAIAVVACGILCLRPSSRTQRQVAMGQPPPPVPAVVVEPPAEDHDAERIAFELSSRAESAHGMIDGESDEFKSFFAAEIRAFGNSRRAGDDAKRSAKYVIATNLLTLALNQATEIKKANDRRNRCGEAIASADRVRASAADVGAVSEAKAAYDEADEQLKAARDALRGKKFDTALSKANAAERRFGEIRSNVVSGVLALAREHAKAERWEQCLKSAEKVLGWEPANVTAESLKREALRNLEPTVRVVARLNGREVSATATLDGESVVFPLPERKLTKGANWPGSAVTVTYREGSKKFKGTLGSREVDWRGSKVLTVVLTQIKEDGLYKVIDLDSGAVEDLDGVPSGGWTDVYKTSKIVLRRIEPGKFTMGSPPDEEGRPTKEESKKWNWYENQHRVTLTKPYYIGVFEVTQGQWRRLMGSNPSKFTKGDMRPVERVSYGDIRGEKQGKGWPSSRSVDAGSFLGKLRMATKCDGFDLPTEAEWEYACRAGSTTAYSWGNALNGNEANCDGNYPCGTTEKGPYKEETCDVGSYEPNAWGLYDMHGNVREWCLDWHEAQASGATDPKGPSSGARRVLRGCGWRDFARDCRSASRDGLGPGGRSYDLGFRVACSAGSYE